MQDRRKNQQKILKFFRTYKRNVLYLDFIKKLQNNGDYSVVVKEENAAYVTKKDPQTSYATYKEFDILMMIDNLETYIYLRDILYKQLDSDEKKLAGFKFNEGCSVFQVMTKMFISEAKYYRLSRQMSQKLNSYYKAFEVLFP